MKTTTYTGPTCRQAVERYAADALKRGDMSTHMRFTVIAARLPSDGVVYIERRKK